MPCATGRCGPTSTRVGCNRGGGGQACLNFWARCSLSISPFAILMARNVLVVATALLLQLLAVAHAQLPLNATQYSARATG